MSSCRCSTATSRGPSIAGAPWQRLKRSAWDGVYHRPNQLSGGQQQRVAIARAIVNNPQIILADEPTGALDSRTSLEIMAIFQQLNRERSITIVLVTHEPDIAQCANRVIQFRDGVVVFDERVHKPRRAAEELNQTPQGSLDTTLASSERMPA